MRASKWKDDIIRLRLDENKPWDEIIEKYSQYYPGISRDKVKKSMYDLVSKTRRKQKDLSLPEDKPSNGFDEGTYNSDRIITICETDEITPELILKLHHLPADKWEVVTYKNNFWHSQKKGGKRLVMYQSKLVVRPKNAPIPFDEIKKFFEITDFDVKRTPIQPLQYDPSGDILLINVADLHNGLYAWFKETGANYNTDIAREFLMRALADILGRCQGGKFKKIVLTLLGDLLHTDNDVQSTTKGTLQQVDGRQPNVFTKTLEMLIEFIDNLLAIAPVEVIYLRGNHDYLIGWTLAKCLEMAYRMEPNVFVDVSPDTQKERLLGCVLVGFVHGDMPEKNLSGWLQVKARKMGIPIKFMEVHSGHRHDLKVKERIQTESVEGVVVRTMPALCNSSTWSHNEGLVAAIQAVVCYIYNDNGLHSQWYCNM
jgi:hypothetical protein